MSDQLKSLFFALVLCLVCSTLLTAASTKLKPIQEKNIQLDRKKNILKSIGMINSNNPPATSVIQTLYKDTIVKYFVDNSGTIVDIDQTTAKAPMKLMPIYLAVDKNSNDILSYIIPVKTKGLWGEIHGYLALKKDGSTIEGFTVYKHSETPGLGGEIENKWFQDNFIGKKIVDDSNNFVSISVAKGKASDQISEKQLVNYVDGISGATLTGTLLSKGLENILSAYEPVSVRFRQDVLQCRMQAETPWCKNENKK